MSLIKNVNQVKSQIALLCLFFVFVFAAENNKDTPCSSASSALDSATNKNQITSEYLTELFIYGIVSGELQMASKSPYLQTGMDKMHNTLSDYLLQKYKSATETLHNKMEVLRCITMACRLFADSQTKIHSILRISNSEKAETYKNTWFYILKVYCMLNIEREPEQNSLMLQCIGLLCKYADEQAQVIGSFNEATTDLYKDAGTACKEFDVLCNNLYLSYTFRNYNYITYDAKHANLVITPNSEYNGEFSAELNTKKRFEVDNLTFNIAKVNHKDLDDDDEMVISNLLIKTALRWITCKKGLNIVNIAKEDEHLLDTLDMDASWLITVKCPVLRLTDVSDLLVTYLSRTFSFAGVKQLELTIRSLQDFSVLNLLSDDCLHHLQIENNIPHSLNTITLSEKRRIQSFRIHTRILNLNEFMKLRDMFAKIEISQIYVTVDLQIDNPTDCLALIPQSTLVMHSSGEVKPTNVISTGFGRDELVLTISISHKSRIAQAAGRICDAIEKLNVRFKKVHVDIGCADTDCDLPDKFYVSMKEDLIERIKLIHKVRGTYTIRHHRCLS